jgi:hypothetical protein
MKSYAREPGLIERVLKAVGFTLLAWLLVTLAVSWLGIAWPREANLIFAALFVLLLVF